MTFLTLTFLYLGAIIILVGVMPWNRAGVTESPFVTVFRSVSLPGAAHFMNFVVLTAALSGANAALYISSRMLFSLARTGWAPRGLGRLSTKRHSDPGPARFVLRNRRRTRARTLGPRPRLRIHSPRRILRHDALLDRLARRPHQLPPRGSADAQAAEIPARSPLGKWGSIIGLIVVLASIGKTWCDSRVNLIAD